jgi:HEAT repeat protein
VLLEQLKSPDATVRTAAVDSLSQAGVEVVGPLFDLMGGDNRTVALAARRTVERMVQAGAAPGSAIDRAELSRRLAREALANRPVEVRTFAVRMIAFIGRDEVVPALAQLLEEPEMAEIARWALVRIPGRASIEALAAALPASSGELKIGIINALGERREAGALPALEVAVNSDDAAVRAAALAAIGRIPSGRSEQVLRTTIQRGGAAGKSVAWDAYVKVAEGLLASGEGPEAEQAYRFIYANGPNVQLRCAGIIGLGRTGRPQALRTVLEALSRPTLDLQGAAVEALVAAPGSEATRIIAEQMLASRGFDRVLVAGILGRRGDAAAVKGLAIASRDKAEPVRLAATQALGEIGDPAAVIPLIARLKDESKRVRDSAERSLVWLRGEPATRAEIRAMVGAPASVRTALIRALGNRVATAAMPALLNALHDKSKPVRLAALEGIAVCARLTDTAMRSRLMEILRTGDKEERQAAEHALSRVPVGMFSAKEKASIVGAASKAPAPVRAALLRIAAGWNDSSLMNLFLQDAAAGDDEVAVAALGGLTRLLAQPVEAASTSRIADEMVRIASVGTPAVKASAMRAYLALADQRRQSDVAGALEMYHLAIGMTTDDADRRIALRGIGAIGDIRSLPVVEPLLEQGAVAGEAAAAIMPIAEKLAEAGEKERAIELFRKAVRVSGHRELINAAAERLRALGVGIDLAAEAGFVTHWWVLGPFPGRKQMSQRDAVPTDAPIDLAAAVTAEGKAYNWKYARVADAVGMLDLREAVAPQEDCAAYAYAEVTSDTDRDVIFKIGSDDGVVCWLNGKRIHSYNEDRGYAPDQDIVPTHLRAGMNFVLLKVLNGGADWGCGLRITDGNDMPLHLAQRRP